MHKLVSCSKFGPSCDIKISFLLFHELTYDYTKSIDFIPVLGRNMKNILFGNNESQSLGLES